MTGMPKGRPPIGQAAPPIIRDIGLGYRLFIARRPELYAGRHIAVDRPDGSVLGWFNDEDVACATAERDKKLAK